MSSLQCSRSSNGNFVLVLNTMVLVQCPKSTISYRDWAGPCHLLIRDQSKLELADLIFNFAVLQYHYQ